LKIIKRRYLPRLNSLFFLSPVLASCLVVISRLGLISDSGGLGTN
jgi:hypothetical protein